MMGDLIEVSKSPPLGISWSMTYYATRARVADVGWFLQALWMSLPDLCTSSAAFQHASTGSRLCFLQATGYGDGAVAVDTPHLLGCRTSRPAHSSATELKPRRTRTRSRSVLSAPQAFRCYLLYAAAAAALLLAVRLNQAPCSR